jgi:hypothetical protein
MCSAINSTGRCIGTIVSNTCRTWSVANLLPDVDGNPGRPWRDSLLGIMRNGSIPDVVQQSNLEIENSAAVALLIAHHNGFVMAESPARPVGPKAYPRHVVPDCERAAHMFDHPAWVTFAEATGAREHIWDQCNHADDPSLVSPKSSVWLATPDLDLPIREVFGSPPLSLCQHPAKTHRLLRGVENFG